MLRRISAFILVVFTLICSGCGDGDNPVKNDDEGEHAEAVGFILRNSGVELVRYENGEVSGNIEVGVGRETALLSVRFIDEDGNLFAPDIDDGFSLGIEIADKAIAEVEQHEEDGAWNFHIIGLLAGRIDLTIKLNHGGHADFVSKTIEVIVEEGGPGEVHEGEDG
jgi:hypothetical protein